MELVWFGVPALVALVVAMIRFGNGSRRRATPFEFATRLGLQYSPTDPFGLIDHQFDLFNLADAARCENVVWGNWHGVEVKVAELSFKPDPQGRRRQPFQGAKRFSFALVATDAWLQDLAIRHDPLASVSETLLLDRLRFESDEFNRMYRVDCADERFAYKLVDARMILWLQDIGQSFPFDFQVNGNRALVWCNRLKPMGLTPLFRAAKGFVDHIPRVVLRDSALSTPDRSPD